MKSFKLLLILLFTLPFVYAEDFDPSYAFGKYFFWDHGAGLGSFRDEGTSPLTYSGIAARLGTGYLGEQKKHSLEFRMNANYMIGFLEQGYEIQNFFGDIQFSYLHTIPAFKNEQLILKTGGKLSATFSGTMNGSYQNASFNYDVYTGLYARGQLTYAFIKPEKQKKRRLVPEKRFALVYHLDLPLMLLNLRPEFPYVIDGNMITLDRHIFLGGYAMQSQIALRHYFNNGNAFETAYIWRMYMTGKRDIYSLESAGHIFQFSYFFKLD